MVWAAPKIIVPVTKMSRFKLLEAFLREVAPALVGAMDEATLARVTEALRVRLDGSPGTPE